MYLRNLPMHQYGKSNLYLYFSRLAELNYGLRLLDLRDLNGVNRLSENYNKTRIID